jgi:hypothetical protein
MSTQPTVTIDQVVEAYVKTRDEMAELRKEFETEEWKMEELQDRRAGWLLQQMDAIGVQNMKSGHGTVYKMRKESVTMGDWDSFFTYVNATQQYNLL